MTLLIEDQFRWRALLHQNIITCLIAWRLLSTLGLILFLCTGHQFFVIQFDPDMSVCSLTQKCLHLHEVIELPIVSVSTARFHEEFDPSIQILEAWLNSSSCLLALNWLLNFEFHLIATYQDSFLDWSCSERLNYLRCDRMLESFAAFGVTFGLLEHARSSSNIAVLLLRKIPK